MVRVKSSAELDRSKTSEKNKKEINLNNLLIIYLYIIIGFGMCTVLPYEYRETSIFYTVIIFGTVFFAALAEHSKISMGFYVFYTLSLLILFCTLGFRDYSGIDDPSYSNI